MSKQEATRLADALRALHDSKQPHPTGPHGQMMGEESWRIVASGNQLYALMEAHDLLRRWPDGEPVAFDHGIGAGRFSVVKGAFWWHIRIGSSTANVGKFHSKRAAEDMALKLLTAFRDGAFLQSKVMSAPTAQSDRIAALEAALGKIDAIRNSIIGAQKVNWSEHIYPLVAALEAAGYHGQEYEVARENVGTMMERIAALEAALKVADEAMELGVAVLKGFMPGLARNDGLNTLRAARRKIEETQHG